MINLKVNLMNNDYVKMNQEGHSYHDLVSYIKIVENKSIKDAKAVLESLGIKPNSSENQDRENCVRIMRMNLSRKEMIEKIHQECGYSKSTSTHYVAALPLCVEYARQELASKK